MITARLHSRSGEVVVPVHLGVVDLADVEQQVERRLATSRARIVLDVKTVAYFDMDMLERLVAIAERGGARVQLRGLDGYGRQLMPEPATPVALVTPSSGHNRVERAVTLLDAVALVTCFVDGRVLSDGEFDTVLALAEDSGRRLVTIDVHHVAVLSPAQVVTLSEFSADLHRAGRSLIVINANTEVAAQLKHAALSGGLQMSLDAAL